VNYYNEFDPFAAAWLRELIKAGHIAPGVVDERSITELKPDELKQYTQCHFFAGIGVWSYALRKAGWPDDRPVWTGSCPCQPFSTAGKRKGTEDERHLWPTWFRLIQECKPDTVFGEQVEAAIRQGWLDIVQTDMEGIGYTVGAVGLPACGFGAPHIRQRLYFVANTANVRCEQRRDAASTSLQGTSTQRTGQHSQPEHEGELSRRLEGLCGSSNLDNTATEGLQVRAGQEILGEKTCCEPQRPSYVDGFWANAEWVFCKDEKFRPVESGTFPLAHGATNRVGRLRGYGNALVAPCAEAFIKAFLEVQIEKE